MKAFNRIQEEINSLKKELEVAHKNNDVVLLQSLRGELRGLQRAFDIVKKSTERQNTAIEKARELLSDCGDDDSVLAIIKKIESNEDQDILIDFLEGVDVWEKVEWEFTCKEFLEVIGWTD